MQVYLLIYYRVYRANPADQWDESTRYPIRCCHGNRIPRDGPEGSVQPHERRQRHGDQPGVVLGEDREPGAALTSEWLAVALIDYCATTAIA